MAREGARDAQAINKMERDEADGVKEDWLLLAASRAEQSRGKGRGLRLTLDAGLLALALHLQGARPHRPRPRAAHGQHV
jgi:hypothetical protein